MAPEKTEPLQGSPLVILHAVLETLLAHRVPPQGGLVGKLAKGWVKVEWDLDRGSH